MRIRTANNGDVPSIAALFTESVHQIAARSYTEAQLAAWAPEPPDIVQWRSRLALLETLVAEVDRVMVGFISYTGMGHIELLYTAPAFMRQGVVSKLCQVAVQRLDAKGVRRISTEASIEARPFFESMGFGIVEEQFVERNGVQLTRFAMARLISDRNAQQGHADDARTSRG